MAYTKTQVTGILKLYQEKDTRRLALSEEAKRLEQEQKALLDQLSALEVKTDSYGPYNLRVASKKVPRCTDWPGFHAYLISTGNLDMLHKRLTESAIMERLDNGEYVPGIVTDDKVTYKVTAK